MREQDLQYLVCPHCYHELKISSVTERIGLQMQSGTLNCPVCHATYPVVRGIPRFVPIENYAANFGLEWNIHARTQYDNRKSAKLSEERFFEETGWQRDLAGQFILEVGSGSGRFTEQAASTDAFVCSLDYSNAVEANYRSNADSKNVMIVQADMYHMPFRPQSFDKVFCFGVLQHTPDVHGAFMSLPLMLKGGGELVTDVYKKTALSFLKTKYYVRPFTQRMEPQKLYKITKRWVDLMWPVSEIIRKIPRIGPWINWQLLVADYSSVGVDREVLKDWAYLDTFDILSPHYDSPQTISTFYKWFMEAGLEDIKVRYAYSIIIGRGKKPKCVA